jgi:hypothetical protein
MTGQESKYNQFLNFVQISIPDDYYQWIETLDAEFEDRLGRILRGPMWSGQSSD